MLVHVMLGDSSASSLSMCLFYVCRIEFDDNNTM